MNITNIEIKARCNNPEHIHAKLRELGADYKGLDNQVDTYFNVPSGRLKLREGAIENALVFYDRDSLPGPKQSNVLLSKVTPDQKLGPLLSRAIGVKVIVDKERHIYFIGNVKFHLDTVKELGSFVEIEAISEDGRIQIEDLRKQCNGYMTLLCIREEELVAESYSDMLLNRMYNLR